MSKRWNSRKASLVPDALRGGSEKMGQYLYGIVDDGREWTDGPLGIEQQEVYTISVGSLAAVVSDFSNQKIRPERRYLAAHQGVLKQLMAEGTALPISFGRIADSRAIERFLVQNQDALIAQLRRVAGKVEMGVSVRWDVTNIFEYFVRTHPKLQDARDRLLRSQSRDQKIEIGQLFEDLLNRTRETYTAQVKDCLHTYCSDIKQNRCRDDREVLNFACLVEKGSRADFEAGLYEAAKLFDDNFAVDYHGPWAPHHFVELNLNI